MRIRTLAVFIGITISVAAAMPKTDECTLVPGVGVGCFSLNRTKRGQLDSEMEQDYLRKGVRFFFDDNAVLETIVSESGCKTDKGISVGDREDRVKQLYGKPKVIQTPLSKGSTPVGTVGERTLAYPGVHFVIVKGKVWAILILPK